MPRLMINTISDENKQNKLKLNSDIASNVNSQYNTQKLDLILRKPRSKDYINLIKNLDHGGNINSESIIEEIRNAYEKEFSRIISPDILIGIISKCYLGNDYDVHLVDTNNRILKHYHSNEILPENLEKFRGLISSNSYLCIEVYNNCYRVVGHDGEVSLIKRKS